MATAALGSGCQFLQKRVDKRTPPDAVIDPSMPRELCKVSMPLYVVEPPDQLELLVKPEGLIDLPNSPFTIRSDGVLDLGFWGDVYVAGLSLDEVEFKLNAHLQAMAEGKNIKIPRDFEVSARLASGSSQSKFYYVLGAVNSPGRFPIVGNETVLDAIMTAGLKSNSLPERAYLSRPQPAGKPDLILKIDWQGIKERGQTLTNYQLFPGDRVVVPGGKPPGLLGSLISG